MSSALPLRAFLALVPLGAAPSWVAAAPPAMAILAAADAIRNPVEPFQVAITLVEYRDRKQQDVSRIMVYAKMNPARQQYDNLVRFLAPAREASKLILKNGNEIWFYDRASQSGVRLSAQQRLLGQASNGDVVTVNLAKDYTAAPAVPDRIQDGDRKERLCWKLTLSAANPDALYPGVEYWVEQDTHHPVKGKFYAASGRLLKTAFYRRYEQQLGRLRPMETVILDGMDPQWVTLMQFSEYRARPIPDAWLRRDGLPGFRD